MSVDVGTFRERIEGYDVQSAKTVQQYCSWVKRFHEWHGGGDITEGVLRDFDRELGSNDPLGARSDPYSYQTRVKALSAVKKWAEVMEDTPIDRNVGDLVHGKEQTFDPYIIDDEEVERLLTETCSLQGCLAARKAGFDLILRASEAMKIQPDDIDFDGGTVYVRASKGSLNRTLSVNDDTLSALGEQYDWVTSQFDDPNKLFYNSSMVKGMSSNAWSHHFSRNHHNAGFHSFGRHTSIVHHLRTIGFGETYIRARHSNPSMTARYSSVMDIDVPEWV